MFLKCITIFNFTFAETYVSPQKQYQHQHFRKGKLGWLTCIKRWRQNFGKVKFWPLCTANYCCVLFSLHHPMFEGKPQGKKNVQPGSKCPHSLLSLIREVLWCYHAGQHMQWNTHTHTAVAVEHSQISIGNMKTRKVDPTYNLWTANPNFNPMLSILLLCWIVDISGSVQHTIDSNLEYNTWLHCV